MEPFIIATICLIWLAGFIISHAIVPDGFGITFLWIRVFWPLMIIVIPILWISKKVSDELSEILDDEE